MPIHPFTCGETLALPALSSSHSCVGIERGLGLALNHGSPCLECFPARPPHRRLWTSFFRKHCWLGNLLSVLDLELNVLGKPGLRLHRRDYANVFPAWTGPFRFQFQPEAKGLAISEKELISLLPETSRTPVLHSCSTAINVLEGTPQQFHQHL